MRELGIVRARLNSCDDGAMSAIRVRRMRFAFSAELDPVFVGGDPEFSFVATAFSLTLP